MIVHVFFFRFRHKRIFFNIMILITLRVGGGFSFGSGGVGGAMFGAAAQPGTCYMMLLFTNVPFSNVMYTWAGY